MRTNYYHTRNYRPREYSQSPQNEPVCQNPHRRTNISIDNYYSKTSHLQSNTIKDPQSSGYYTRYSNAFANSSKKYPYSYGKTFDVNKSHKQQFTSFEQRENSLNQTRPLEMKNVNPSTKEKTKKTKKSKVLYIDVNTKVEEEVLMELYMRICALSMENERQRYQNVNLSKQYNSIVQMLSVKEDNLKRKEAKLNSTLQELARAQTSSSHVNHDTAEIQHLRTRMAESENRIKMLATENERLVELKNQKESEFYSINSKLVNDTRRQTETNETIRYLQSENNKLTYEMNELKKQLSQRAENTMSELGRFENDIVVIKKSYEDKISDLTSLLKSKNNEVSSLKNSLELKRKECEELVINHQRRDTLKTNEINEYASKLMQIKDQLSNMDNKKVKEMNQLKKQNEDLRKENQNLLDDIQALKQMEVDRVEEIKDLKSEKETMSMRLTNKDNEERHESDNLILLIEELQKTIEEQENILKNKQAQYNGKIQEFSEKVRELAKNENKHIEANSKLETRIKVLENENRRLMEEIEMTEEMIEKFKTQNHKGKSSVHLDLQVQEIDRLKKNLMDIETEKKEIAAYYENRVEELNSKYDSIIEERTRIETESRMTKTRLENELTSQKTENKRILRELDRTKSELEKLEINENKVKELQNYIAQKEETVKAKAKEIRELNDRLTEANEKMVSIDINRNTNDQDKINEKKEQYFNNTLLENKLKSLFTQHNSLKEQYDKDVKNYESKIKDLTDKLVNTDMKDNLERRKQGTENLKRIQELNKEILDLKSEMGKLKTENELLKQQLVSLKKEYEQLEEQYEEEMK